MTREDAETLFDLMEIFREEHPEATDDECYQGVCLWSLSKTEARMHSLREGTSDRNIYA